LSRVFEEQARAQEQWFKLGGQGPLMTFYRNGLFELSEIPDSSRLDEYRVQAEQMRAELLAQQEIQEALRHNEASLEQIQNELDALLATYARQKRETLDEKENEATRELVARIRSLEAEKRRLAEKLVNLSLRFSDDTTRRLYEESGVTAPHIDALIRRIQDKPYGKECREALDILRASDDPRAKYAVETFRCEKE
jgi:hypothetical protein